MNSRPFTDTVLPTAICPWPGEPSESIFERVMTVMVLTGGVAPVKRGERPDKVNAPLLALMLAPRDKYRPGFVPAGMDRYPERRPVGAV